MGIIISSLTTKYRDLRFLDTFGVQLFMYATPIVYPLSVVTNEKYRMLLLANPMTPVIEGFRQGFLGTGTFELSHLAYSFAFMSVALALGVLIFNKVEKGFMDTV